MIERYIFNLVSLLLFFFLQIPLKAQTYKIAVLPSGGATAIVSAAFLEHLEEKVGKPINQLFDEIWCSSAEAMIAGLMVSKNKPCSAYQAGEFIEKNFSTFYKSYHARDVIAHILKNELLGVTNIPVRILTARLHGKNHKTGSWRAYGLSSDIHAYVSMADAIKASCTVYPYVYRKPVKIEIDDGKKISCIDPGSLCCENCIVEPTSYFLHQFLDCLDENDSAQIFFFGNGYVQSINYRDVRAVLENKLQYNDFLLHYDEGSFSGQQTKRVEIINLPALFSLNDFFADYLKKHRKPLKHY